MRIKIYYNWIDREDKMPEYSEFGELINHINYCTAYLSDFYEKIANKCKYISNVYNKAYNEKSNNVLTEEDFSNLKVALLVTGRKTSNFFNRGVITEDLVNEAECFFDEDLKCIKEDIISMYKTYKTKLDESYIDEIIERVSNCKTISELILLLKTYYNRDVYGRIIVSTMNSYFSEYLKNESVIMTELIKASNEQRKLIKKLSKLVKVSKQIDYSLVEEVQEKFKNYNFDLKRTLSKDVIDKYNEEVQATKEVLPAKTVSVVNTKKSYETREERIKKYQIKNGIYVDAGDLLLNDEEEQCLKIYLDIIEKLGENDITDFENKTTDYLVELLDKDPYPNNLVVRLLKEVDASDTIDYSYKKRIKKAINHLK